MHKYCFWIVCLLFFHCVLPKFCSAQCNLGSITFNVVDAPEADVIDLICDYGQNGYYVVIGITGGDPLSYTVSSSISGVLTGPPYVFTSDLIPSGEPYQFIVSDANLCGEVSLEGLSICICPTWTGTMDISPLELCEGDTATALHNGDEELEFNDVLTFVLHDDISNTLGTVYGTNTSPDFDFAPPLVVGQTYYISAVAGDNDGGGGVDLNDPCLSVSFGTPVTWNALPTGNLLNDVAICSGDSAKLIFTLTGNGPFDVIYSDGIQQFVLENIDNTDTLFVSPIITTTYTLLSVEDGSAAGCSSTLDSTATVIVNEPVSQNMAAQICAGDSILLGGAMQTQPGVYSDTLNTTAGCDSIIYTALDVTALDTMELIDTSCDPLQVGVFGETFTNQNGCDSVIITTVTFLPTDTVAVNDTSCDSTKVGVFEETYTNQNGCDSLVITTITFSETDSTFLTNSTCNPALAGVFEVTYTNQLGCDSLVTTTVFLLPSDQTELLETTCDPAQSGIFTEILNNQFGCDSTVISTVVFKEADSIFLVDSTCDPAQAGVFEENYTNQYGCDSVVTTTVVLLSSDITELTGTNCDPAQVGVFTEILTNINGCDSTVITTITFSEVDSTFFTNTTCDPLMVGVFSENFTNQYGCDSVATTTVDLMLPDLTEITGTTCDPAQAGIFTEILTNQFGCDSTVILTVTLLSSDETFLAATTCDSTQAGVFTEILTNQFGCDSTVILTVTLLSSDETFLAATTCDSTQAGVFMEILTNQNGCDSVVTTTFTLLPTDETFLTNTTCDSTQAGVFMEILTNQNGCDSVVTTNVSLLAPDECNVEFSLSVAPIPCGNTEGSILIDVLLGQLPLDYSYISTTGNNGIGTLTASPFILPQLPAGQYTVTLTLPNGLSNVEEVEIVQAVPPLVTVEVITNLDCSGVPSAALLANVSGDFPPYSFLWSNGAITPDVSNLGADTYVVTVADTYGCETISEITIVAPSNIEIMLTVNNPDCFDANGGFVEVEATGGDAPYQFSLNSSDFQNDNFFNGLSAGVYQVIVQDANGCEISESFVINAPIPVDVELGDDVSIELGSGAIIQAIVNFPDSLLTYINWSGFGTELECPTCLTQTTLPLVTTTYSIVIESMDGCIGNDDMTLFVDRNRQVFIPNAFSPNGDGINDVFFPFAKENAVSKIHSFLIFSRWGESVFEAFDFLPNDPNHGWNGFHRGDLMQQAVFVWFAEIEFIDGQVVLFEGEVVLVQ